MRSSLTFAVRGEKRKILEVVIKADADFFDTFVDDSPGDWIEAFSDANGDAAKRYNFCGVGDNYDTAADARNILGSRFLE